MITTIPLHWLFAIGLMLQEAPAPEALRSEGRLVNAVRLIVNDEAITQLDIVREVANRAPNLQGEELNNALRAMAFDLVKAVLKEQAGRDLGYDAAMVDAMVQDQMDQRREQAGSVSLLAQTLDQLRLDSGELRETTTNHVYSSLWEGAVSGRFAGPGGRPFVDDFVRPGKLRYEFESKGRRLDLPSMVRFEEMMIAPGEGETIESARQKAFLLVSRLQQGEDFLDLAANFGIPGRDPVLPPIQESKLAAVPEVKAFADSAKPGEVSQPILIVLEGRPSGYRILRFVGRDEGKAASFRDLALQERLRGDVRARENQYREERALKRVLDGAYVWPPDAITRPARSEPAP